MAVTDVVQFIIDGGKYSVVVDGKVRGNVVELGLESVKELSEVFNDIFIFKKEERDGRD